jgi:hypothetical protein
MSIISNDKREADIADAIVSRSYEVYGYDFNIANYTIVLASLSGDWPERLLALRDLPPYEAAARCSEDDVALLSELQQHDQVSRLLRSERVERDKAQRILEAVDSQLVGPGRDAALSAATNRRDSAGA